MASTANVSSSPSGHTDLRRALLPWQIMLLAISGIIGVTIFSIVGPILKSASMVGFWIALAFVSIIAISVMTSLGELVVLWPIPNALVDYVRYFVDEDLSMVIGLAYWYTWSSFFTLLFLIAYDYFCLFLASESYRILIFIVFALLCTAINGVGVRTYGNIESVGGAIKFANALAGGIFLWVAIATKGAANNGPWLHDSDNDYGVFTGICMSIEVLAFGMLGVEIVAVTASEAVDRRALRKPVKWIAWVIVFIYFWVAIPGAIYMHATDPYLGSLDSSKATSPHTAEGQRVKRMDPPTYAQECQNTFPLVVLAAWRYGSEAAAYYINACIVYFCISSANTALYVASRTLYGLARPITPPQERPQKWWQQIIPSRYLLGQVAPNGIPTWALLASAVSWVWLIAIRAADDGVDVLSIMTTIGCVGGVTVWAAQCFAFIKYYEWLSKWGSTLESHYNRKDRRYVWQMDRPWLNSFQPYVAWVGFFGCLLIIFVLCSATFWQTKATPAEVVAAYIGPALAIVLFGLLRLWRFIRKNPTDTMGATELAKTLEDLSGLVLSEEEMAPQDGEQGRRWPRGPYIPLRGMQSSKLKSSGTVQQLK